MKVEGKTASGSKTEKAHISGVVPEVGGSLLFNLTDKVSLLGGINGLWLGNASLYEGNLGLNWKVTPNIKIGAGYSSFNMGGKSGDFKLAHRIGGPYLHVGIEF